MAAQTMLRDFLCLSKGESILVTADANTDHRVVRAIQAAAHMLGGNAVALVLDPPLPLQGLLADKYLPAPLVAAAQACDLWIDATMPYIAGSKAFDLVMEQRRARYFLACDLSAESIIRMFGKVDQKALFRFTDLFQSFLDESTGKEVHITSPAGTDVRFTHIKLPPEANVGLTAADKPGGYFAPGTAALAPILESVKGTIVVEAVIHDYYTVLSEPIRLELNGTITSVSGGGTELAPMERALRRAANGGYGGIVHFSCGHHPAARVTGRSFTEDQRTTGCNAIGFGFPPFMPGGGENHPDGLVRNQSIWIGGEQIVDRGVICGPSSLVQAYAALELIY